VTDPNDPSYVFTDISWSIDPDIWERARSQLAQILVGAPFSGPAMTITQSADKASAQSGDTITFTIQYQNTGDADAMSAVISDMIPIGTTPVAGSATGAGTFSEGTVQWTLGTVPANAPAGQVSFQVKVN
jgi:uncharacterized repeat protein (TIGR01451 family)